MATLQTLSPRFITVDRDEFTVKFWKLKRNKYRVVKQYTVAVGAVGYQTPTGMYFVDVKAKEPSWLAPNSDWVPESLRGKVIPYGDPINPFDGPFISFDKENGYGLHGTKSVDTIGFAASHGCIRMKPDDARDLFHRSPVNTPVFIY